MKVIRPFAAMIAVSLALTTPAVAGAELDAVFKAPADKLWQLVEFHQPSENIMPPVSASEVIGDGVGARKLNTLDGGGMLELQLVYFDPESRAFNYVIRSSPLPLKNYVGEVRVEDLGEGRSRLTWNGFFEPDGVSEAKADETVQGFYNAIAAQIAKTFPRE